MLFVHFPRPLLTTRPTPCPHARTHASTVFFHTVKQLEIQHNVALYAVVLLCTALLLTVAYHAFAVHGSRRYMRMSDVLSSTMTSRALADKMNSIESQGRLGALAFVNTAYLLAVFVLSFQTFCGRFETHTFVQAPPSTLHQQAARPHTQSSFLLVALQQGVCAHRGASGCCACVWRGRDALRSGHTARLLSHHCSSSSTQHNNCPS